MRNNKSTIIFRADGNSKIGLGHVVRSLALASMLKDNFRCIFAIQNPGDSIRLEILGVCEDIIELPESSYSEIELLPFLNGREIVVLDGYSFATEYQRHIKDKGCKLACIDDIHAYHFVSDIVINHAGGINESQYSVENYTKCFLGLKYVLLRPPFLKADRIKTQRFENLFLNMGGADPKNDTCEVLKEVIKYPNFAEIHVVVGSAYSFIVELSEIVSLDSRIILHKDLSAIDLEEVMSHCGIGICPASTVSIEYGSVGGLLFLKVIADNQKEIKKFFIEKKLAFDFGVDFFQVINNLPDININKIIKNQALVFDGRSGERIKLAFAELRKA